MPVQCLQLRGTIEFQISVSAKIKMAVCRMSLVQSLLLVLPLFAIAVGGARASVAAGSPDAEITNDTESPWQQITTIACEAFLAPSSLPSGGWGVFAGRDFEENDIVEIAPRFIIVPYETPVAWNSQLNDFQYGYLRRRKRSKAESPHESVKDDNDETHEVDTMAAIVFGHVMFYNHHRDPNIRWISSFGREPTANEPHYAQAVGWVARRKIFAGEELFATYGTHDGGNQWFQDRKLNLVVIPAYASRKNGTVYDEDKKTYCSKVYAGYGRPTWNDRVMAAAVGLSSSAGGTTGTFPFKIDANHRLAPTDHPSAVSNQDVKAGTVMEIAPALALSKAVVANTPLAFSSFFWDDWDEEQQKDLKNLRESNDLRVQYQGADNDWLRIDAFVDFEDVVVFPAAGNIALVDRIGKSDEANCKIKILASGSMKSHLGHGGANGSAGIVLQLVAIKDIPTGARLKLNIGNAASPRERDLLLEELRITGQPIPDYLGAPHDETGTKSLGQDEL